jgi:hypothetical protein
MQQLITTIELFSPLMIESFACFAFMAAFLAGKS